MTRPLRPSAPGTRRTLAAERYAAGDRLALGRQSTCHIAVHANRCQGLPPTFDVRVTLHADAPTEVQLTGRLRDLEMLARTLTAALAEARRTEG